MVYTPEQFDPTDRNTVAAASSDLSLLSVSPQGRSRHLANGEIAATKTHSAEAKQADQWTYVVNLTAVMEPALGPNGAGGAGSEYKFNQLMKLANLTKNTNAEVIVQSYNPALNSVDRYELLNGQLHRLATVKSAGLSKDLQNVLALAPKTGHLALIQEAHGNGDIGFETDNGSFSVSNFRQSVKAGLKATGRTSLDVLSMDSCLMGNVQVIAKMSGLAQGVVASELEEFSSVGMSHSPPITQFDMQPIDKYLTAMIKNPPKDGMDAAATIVAVSARSCDNTEASLQTCGTPTLAIYHPEAAPAAEQALDQFGVALQPTIRDRKSAAAIDGLLKRIPEIDENSDHLRDVDTFARGILSLVDKGVIRDQNHRLAQAAQNVLNADQKLVSNFYLNRKARIVQLVGAENLSGENAFIPGPDFDIRSEAEAFNSQFDAQHAPKAQLLDKEILRSLPDDYPSGWSRFVKEMRAR